MSQLKCSSTWWSPRRCSAMQLVDRTTPQNSKVESRGNTLQRQRLRCNWAGLIALAFLSMAPLRAAPLLNSASALTSAAASVHGYEYCRFLTNGRVRNCEFSSMKQCKATSQQCERYPFLAYCHFSPTGWVQRCDFDTLAECKTASSGFDGYCGRSPYLTTQETPMPINQKPPYSKRERPLEN
jgi:hypothetical protein